LKRLPQQEEKDK